MDECYTGMQIGDYIVKEQLGNGASSSVFRAEHVQDGTTFAIKIIHKGQGEYFNKEYLNEEKRLSLLKHHHIIPMFDAAYLGDDTGYIVMKYVKNGSLRQQFAGKRVAFGLVAEYVKQAASALEHIYELGMVHRDVKPENILLDENNVILLCDFGIAASRFTLANETRSYDLKPGTYEFMAPELWQGGNAFSSEVSDQYALALVAYELLSGVLPFPPPVATLTHEERKMRWSNNHQHVQPLLLKDVGLEISEAVEQVIMKALAKKPKERFPSISLFATQLAEALVPKQAAIVVEDPLRETHMQMADARGKNDMEEEYRLIQYGFGLPDASNSIYFSFFQTRRGQLRPLLIRDRIMHARTFHERGQWREEIQTWESIQRMRPFVNEIGSHKLVLVADERRIQKESVANTAEYVYRITCKRITIAQQNEQYEYLYRDVQQCIGKEDIVGARLCLTTLWQKAPYYGDPEGITASIGMKAALCYEQHVNQEQLKQEQMEALWGKALRLLFALLGGVITGITAFTLLKMVPFGIFTNIYADSLTSFVSSIFVLVLVLRLPWENSQR